MRKMLFTLILVLFAGTGAFAKTFKAGDSTIDAYASIRAYSAFNHTDGGQIASPPDAGNILDASDRSRFAIGLQANSRAGVRWTHGDFFFHNEFGMGGDTATTNLTLRLLYGDYKFAGGEKGRIRVGQLPGTVHTFSLFDRKLNGDSGLQGMGTMIEARRAGINYAIGGFSISALSMRQDSNMVTGRYSGAYANSEFSEIMPRIEASYVISSVKIGGSYVKSSITANNTSTGDLNKRYSLDAGHIVFAANPKIGDNVKLTVSGFYSVNGGMYQMVSMVSGNNDAEAVGRTAWALPQLKTDADGNMSATGEMDNTTAFGGAVALTVKDFEAGFGGQSTRNDAWQDDVNGMGFYANYRFKLGSYFKIIPEVGYVHTGKRLTQKTSANRVVDGERGFQAGLAFRIDI
ncbi:MAG: hypothetical protein LBJ21_02615 [Acidobacteriota bacterium]|jgi:hypothetical protein|nr:hypothetical protein [Acidobacteriota bacterium]